MRLSSKGHYSIRAMLDLAARSGEAVRLQEISTRQSIDLHYLEQLSRKLRVGKVVKSVRGPGSGYVLARPADKISVRDVLDCVGENIDPSRDILPIPSSGFGADFYSEGVTVDTAELNRTKDYFRGLGELIENYLSKTTIADLIK